MSPAVPLPPLHDFLRSVQVAHVPGPSTPLLDEVLTGLRRNLESRGTFKQGGMRLRDASDASTFKVRRGKVGGYREDFRTEQVAELEALVRERISPSLGYCLDGVS